MSRVLIIFVYWWSAVIKYSVSTSPLSVLFYFVPHREAGSACVNSRTATQCQSFTFTVGQYENNFQIIQWHLSYSVTVTAIPFEEVVFQDYLTGRSMSWCRWPLPSRAQKSLLTSSSLVFLATSALLLFQTVFPIAYKVRWVNVSRYWPPGKVCFNIYKLPHTFNISRKEMIGI